jgi:flagellar basal-body rod protein FlgB
MIGDSLMSSTVQRALDGVWQRQKAISSNLANFDTPHYKAKIVNFEDTLRDEILKIQDTAKTRDEIRSHLDEVETSRIAVTSDFSISERADGNNVNLDEQQIELAKAQLQYMYLTNSITNMYSRLKTAITNNG